MTPLVESNILQKILELLRIADSGIYVLIAAPQVGRTSGTKARFVDFWLRKNGTDIQNSNVRVVIGEDSNKDVIVNQTMMPFNAW